MGRLGATFSGPTFTSRNSGRYGAPGAPISSLPSSARIIAATVTIGLVIDAMRKIESFAIGFWLLRSWKPVASSVAILPWRATSSTEPGTLLESTSDLRILRKRSRRCEETPTSSGRFAIGSDCAKEAAAERTNVNRATDVVLEMRIAKAYCSRRGLSIQTGRYLKALTVPGHTLGSATMHP